MAAQNSTETNSDLRRLFEEFPNTKDEKAQVWLKSVTDKLYCMFRSHLKDEIRCEAFKWVANLCMTFGDFSWVSANDDWSPEEIKIFNCIASLSLNEVQLLSPLVERALTQGPDPEMKDGKVYNRSATLQEYDRFGDHLVILESMIRSLIKNGENDGDSKIVENMQPKDLDQLLARLRETMNSVFEYLAIIHKHWHELAANQDDEKTICARGALKVVCVWLSEDYSMFEKECKDYIIDLILKNMTGFEACPISDVLITTLHSITVNNNELLEHAKTLPTFRSTLETYLEQAQKELKSQDRRGEKLFKLRCGMIKDLLVV